MKLGLTEMLVIGIVIMIIISATRFFPMKSRQPEPAPARQLTAVEARDEEILRRRRAGKGKYVGFALVIVGVLLIASAPALIKYVLFSYVGGALIIVAGLLSLFLMLRRS